MALEPTAEGQSQLALTHLRRAAVMTPAERLVVPLVSLAFLAADAGLWWRDPPSHLQPLAALLSLGVMVLANRVQFETPLGFTVATQLAFIPLVFALPPALVPLGVAFSLALSAFPEVRAGRIRPARLLYVFRNAWFALGPAYVFALTTRPEHAGAPILLAAIAAQFLLDAIASSVIVLATRRVRLREQMREGWVYLVDAALSGVGLVVAEQMRVTPFAVLAIVPLLGLLSIFARERTGRLANMLELKDTYRGTALLLGEVVTADDTYTGRHSEGVVQVAMAVAHKLGLPAERRRNLEFAALLHDVGKITIPKKIIHKKGSLEPDEWALVQTHSAEGQRMLARVGDFMTEVGQIVRSHHERWDGGGYPDGLLGDAAPLEARIITCCDSWSAMRTDRPYRPALSHEAAVAEIISCSGAQFDPRIAQVLLIVVNALGREHPISAPPIEADSLLAGRA